MAMIPHAIQNGTPLPGSLLDTSAMNPNISKVKVSNYKQMTDVNCPSGIEGS